MAYGWSAKQMARVNERRSKRGQEELSPGKVSEDYISDYYSEYKKRNAQTDNPKRKFPETDEDETKVANRLIPKTPSLNNYKERNEALSQRRKLQETDRGIFSAAKLKMFA